MLKSIYCRLGAQNGDNDRLKHANLSSSPKLCETTSRLTTRYVTLPVNSATLASNIERVRFNMGLSEAYMTTREIVVCVTPAKVAVYERL